MQTTSITIPVRPEYTYVEKVQLAVFHRPVWMQSLTIADSDPYHLRVTYSDNPNFGGTLIENMQYLKRHGLRAIAVFDK